MLVLMMMPLVAFGQDAKITQCLSPCDKELDKELVVRKFRTTTQHGAIEGKTQTHEVLHYNLDVIIALGYRVQSPIAVRFRRWATRLLHEYIQKGFTMDDECLKQGGSFGIVLTYSYL